MDFVPGPADVAAGEKAFMKSWPEAKKDMPPRPPPLLAIYGNIDGAERQEVAHDTRHRIDSIVLK